MKRTPSLFSVPFLPKKESRQILDLTDQWYKACLSKWKLKISTLNINNEEKQALQECFSLLIDHLNVAFSDPAAYSRQFQDTISKWQDLINFDHIVMIAGFFEEILIEILLKNRETIDFDSSFRWIHTLVMNLLLSTYQQFQLPIFIRSKQTEKPWDSPLLRLLKRIPTPENWSWVALGVNKTELKIIDLAVRNPESGQWSPAQIREDLSSDVLQVFHGKTEDGIIEDIDGHLLLAVKGAQDQQSKSMCRKLANWIRHAIELSSYHREIQKNGHDQISIYEAILEFDNALLSAQSVEDILISCVKDVCKIAGFQRSALFWYSPITRTFEGIHSYNTPLEEIQRIREPERNVLALYQVLKEGKPIHFERVTNYLPHHYVEHFYLTSLFISPLYGEDRRTIGVLLLDQNGQPFFPSDRAIETVDSLLTRASKVLQSQLHLPQAPIVRVSSMLTQREQQILQMIADGQNTKEIAAELYISEYTISEYISSILKKLGAKNRSQAVAKALRQNLIR